MSNEPDEEYLDLSRPRKGTRQVQRESNPGCNLWDLSEKGSGKKSLNSDEPDLMPLSLTTQCLLIALKKW